MTKMRQVYRLLGLVDKWGPDRVDEACRRALDAEAVNVGLIARMLERATERATEPPPATGAARAGRFARDPHEFAVDRRATRRQPADATATSEHNADDSDATQPSIPQLRAAYVALCTHVRDVHGVDPTVGTAGQVEAAHQAAHAREGTRWHPHAWRLPDTDEVNP